MLMNYEGNSINVNTGYNRNSKLAVSLEKGDYLEIFVASATDSSYNVVAGTYLNISKRQSPQQMLANEVISGVANTDGTANGNISSGTTTTILYDNTLDDTHGILNTSTGIITAPRSGKITLHATMLMNSSTAWAGGEYSQASISIGGVIIYNWQQMQSSLNIGRGHVVTIVGYPINKDDEIKVQLEQQSGANQTLAATSDYNVLSWRIE